MGVVYRVGSNRGIAIPCETECEGWWLRGEMFIRGRSSKCLVSLGILEGYDCCEPDVKSVRGSRFEVRALNVER